MLLIALAINRRSNETAPGGCCWQLGEAASTGLREGHNDAAVAINTGRADLVWASIGSLPAVRASSACRRSGICDGELKLEELGMPRAAWVAVCGFIGPEQPVF